MPQESTEFSPEKYGSYKIVSVLRKGFHATFHPVKGGQSVFVPGYGQVGNPLNEVSRFPPYPNLRTLENHFTARTIKKNRKFSHNLPNS